VYMTNSIGPKTDPCGTPHINQVVVDLLAPRRTCCIVLFTPVLSSG